MRAKEGNVSRILAPSVCEPLWIDQGVTKPWVRVQPSIGPATLG